MTRRESQNETKGYFSRETKRHGKQFYKKYWYKGVQHTKKLKADDGRGEPIRVEALARLEARRIDDCLRKGENPFKDAPTVADWITDYLDYWKPPRNAQSTHDDKTFRLRYWEKWHAARFPDAVNLTDLTTDHFAKYQTREGVKARTVNLDFRYLRHALNWAVDKEWLPKSPIAKLKRLPEPQSPRKTVSAETIAAVLKHLPPVAKAAWAFCSETGVRPGEMFALRWEQLDTKARKATYVQGKTGKVKTVWYSSETAKLIGAIPPKGATVFYNAKGQPFNRLSWRDTVYRAADAAGLMKWGEDGEDGKKKRQGGKRIVWGTPPNPYALRHTVTTAMLQEADIATVRDAMGHSNLSVTSIYAHSSEERIKAAFERLQKRKKG